MKHFKTKIMISVLTFALGIFAVAIWLVKSNSKPETYSTEFNALMLESKNYDGKIVEMQVFYVQGYEASFLTDSNRKEFVTATCSSEKESCEKIFDTLQNSLAKQEKISVIGRYYDSEYQDYDGYVHTIDILSVKPINTTQATE